MQYPFPHIENISDVLPAILGSPEFVVSEREDHLIVNYNIVTPTTFPSVYDEAGNYNYDAAVRRECRGIIFDRATGNIIRRPFHKFFNLNEREETLASNIDLADFTHQEDKLDGSMIAPYMTSNGLIWGTKMGDTDVGKGAQAFVDKHPEYTNFAIDCINRELTPIFEWCSRTQRIVLDYSEDQLILTAVRDMKTGKYLDTSYFNTWRIPIVAYSNIDYSSAADHAENIRNLKGIEGFVLVANGHRLKVKTDEYVAIHKAKEKILQERNILEMILSNTMDDVKAHLPDDDVKKINDFEADFYRLYRSLNWSVHTAAALYVNTLSRKEFALGTGKDLDGLTRSVIFSVWDNPSASDVETKILSVIMNHLGKTSSYDELKSLWFPNLKYEM